MTPFTINSATAKDLPFLLAMIRELAEFERLAQELEVTADFAASGVVWRTSGRRALCWRAWTASRRATRFITTRFPPSSDAPEFFSTTFTSAQNFANAAWPRAARSRSPKSAWKSAADRFEWIALRWNENAFRFYRSLGAKVMDEWALLRMNSREVRKPVAAKVKVAG